MFSGANCPGPLWWLWRAAGIQEQTSANSRVRGRAFIGKQEYLQQMEIHLFWLSIMKTWEHICQVSNESLFQVPPTILSKFEDHQLKIFPKNSNYGEVPHENHYQQHSKEEIDDFQTSFKDKETQYKRDKEITKLQEENNLLNKILSSLFPDSKIVSKREQQPAFAPIFRTTTPGPTIIFKKNHDYENKFIIPSKTILDDCAPFTCQAPKPSRFDRYVDDYGISRVQEIPSDDQSVFKDFSSLDEIKKLVKDDPSFFTRLQGLENLRKTSPQDYSRSLKSTLGRMMSKTKERRSRHLQKILSSRFRRSAELILKRPAIFDRLSLEAQDERGVAFEPPSERSPVQFYSSQEIPSQFYTVPATVAPPSNFYGVPSAENPISSFSPPDPAPADSQDPHPQDPLISQQDTTSSQEDGGRFPFASSSSSSVPSATILLQKPPAIATQDQLVVSQITSAVDLPVSSVSDISLSSSSSSSSTTSGFDRNTALLTALGLSLIPTLAISIPFLAPAFRRRNGRSVEDKKKQEHQERILENIQSPPLVQRK